MKRIELTIFDLAARAERPVRFTHRNIDVGAQAALLHIPVTGTEVTQNRANLGDVGLGLLGGAQIGLRYDLHQRHTGSIEIDERQSGVLIVQRLAGVLLEMQPLDADTDRLAIGYINDDFAFTDDR